MRVTVVATITALALSVAASPVAAPEPELVVRWCRLPGQSCSETKADAVSEPELAVRWCRLPGQSCSKAKRSADATAEAYAVTGADPGTPPLSHRLPAFNLEPTPLAEAWCRLPGQSCSKTKRVAAPEPEPEPAAEAWCRLPGQSCSKVKRDARPELFFRWCRLPGQSCSRAKRAADVLAEAAALVTAEI